METNETIQIFNYTYMHIIICNIEMQQAKQTVDRIDIDINRQRMVCFSFVYQHLNLNVYYESRK